jgi:hypothetical protein
MMKDFVWRQFLLFCYRNGLYYGETLNDTSALHWNEAKTVVRYHQPDTANFYTSAASQSHEALEENTNVVNVGTLERLLRQ